MKKIIYYASPLVFIPAVCLLLSLIDDVESIGDTVCIIITYVLFLGSSAVIGNLSPSEKKFDVIISLIVPSVLILSIFTALLFDSGLGGGDTNPLSHALNTGYYGPWLQLAVKMAAVTILSSYKPIRLKK